MSEIPVDQVKFEMPKELPTFRLDRERNIALNVKLKNYQKPSIKHLRKIF